MPPQVTSELAAPIGLSVAEAARRLSLSNWTVYQLCIKGEIVARKVGSRWIVDADALRDFVRQGSSDEATS